MTFVGLVQGTHRTLKMWMHSEIKDIKSLRYIIGIFYFSKASKTFKMAVRVSSIKFYRGLAICIYI